jgi:mannose-6-phosphate isomerase-like protein (cupin superfamily)
MFQAATRTLAPEADVIAPDGCAVRILAQTPRGSMAHFTLGPGQVARAVAHRTVEEIWYFLSGHGRMWRRQGDEEEIVEVAPGLSLSIPLGTHFQVRNDGEVPLAAVAVTMPPWPGADEAYFVTGRCPRALAPDVYGSGSRPASSSRLCPSPRSSPAAEGRDGSGPCPVGALLSIESSSRRRLGS